MQGTTQRELEVPTSATASPMHNRSEAAAFVQSIFEREMGVTLHNSKAGSRRDEAMHQLTKEASNLYVDRVLRELIQNAFDGTENASKPRILVRLDLSQGPHGTLLVANNGQGFTSDNVDAISNPAMSNKTPGNFIGHKGLGFRSVELISDCVQIYSKATSEAHEFDGFCFRFASHIDELEWLERAGELVHADSVVGRTHPLQLPIPIYIDHPDAAAIAKEGFVTLILLPLRDSVAVERCCEEMRLLLDEKAPITLFLDRLTSLTLQTVDRAGTIDTKTLKRSSRGAQHSQRGRDLTIEEVSVDRHRFLVGRMRVDEEQFLASVHHAVERKYPVERWLEWKGAPTISIALPLSQDCRSGLFYAFLPMDTEAPFNGCLDAPFFPKSDRRDLDLNNPLNSFLLNSVADLSLAVAQTIADAEETSPERAAAAIDALSWTRDSKRMIDACGRAGLRLSDIRLPAIRRKDAETRWPRLDDIFDWSDDDFKIIKGTWLVRVCDVPMLRRGLGSKRAEALRSFVEDIGFTFEPADSNWSEWGPRLAADLAGRRRKATKQEWEAFYADLASMKDALIHFRGKAIFCLDDGTLGQANSPEALEDRELFISRDADNSARARKRMSGTSLIPPKSITRRMLFADLTVSWPANVIEAFVNAGLASEYSLPKVIAGMGRLLGKRPPRQTALAAINWAFGAWKSHKSVEVEKALRTAALQVPTADGKFRGSDSTKFGLGWRETHGDLLAAFCEAMGEESRGARQIKESLLPPWESWPLRDKGTISEWVLFLRLLGVKDGLTPVYYKSVTMEVNSWWAVRTGTSRLTNVETQVGPYWRATFEQSLSRFQYGSGSYSTDNTLIAFPLQGEHAAMNDRAKSAYARLILRAFPDLAASHFSTNLRRTSGYIDNVTWPSPLMGFLQEACWLPVMLGEDISWSRSRECWFAPKIDKLPYFIPRIERSIRDALDANSSIREAFARRLGLKLWNDPASSLDRLKQLGEILEGGILEHEHDRFRSEYRLAWADWHNLNPRPGISQDMPLVLQANGRMVSFRFDPDNAKTVFVGGGTDPTLENLLLALGHLILSVPHAAATDAAAALSAAGLKNIRLVTSVRPRIIVDGLDLDLAKEWPRLAEGERDWLAEIAVLVLEFNNGPIGRSTAKSRQVLYDAFRGLRIVQARRVEVEIDDLNGELPSILDGVLPVPHEEKPTIVVQSAEGELDWPTLARIGRGVALALDRSWLLTDFRAAFLAIANSQYSTGSRLTRPDDAALAKAFGQQEERIREIRRSLRAANRRILDWLIPIVHVRFGSSAAALLLDREHSLIEEEDIVAVLSKEGIAPDDIRDLLQVCAEAESLDEFRRSLAIPLSAFNAATATLGPPFPRLCFETTLRRLFADRLDELRPQLAERVRDAFASETLEATHFEAYSMAAALEWLTFDESWITTHDDLDDATIDAHIEELATTNLPRGATRADGPLDELRQVNRVTLMKHFDEVRRLIAAWAAKDTTRSAPQAWEGKPELLARDTLTSGVFDFKRIDRQSLPEALQLASLWPEAMRRSFELADLGLVSADLDHQVRAEQQRRDDEDRRARTIRIGSIEVVGASNESFQAMVGALQEVLQSKAFQKRSGPASLRDFPESDDNWRTGRGRGRSNKDPTYLSDDQRKLIGFAGEYAAYMYLRRTVRNFADDHWISSMGRSYLCLSARQDEEGYDFHVPRSRGGLYFEVKAHVGDPGHVDLERSQVAAAVSFADERQGIWKILYVSNALDPASICVYELGNPFSEKNAKLFRPSTRQGIRLLIDRQ